MASITGNSMSFRQEMLLGVGGLANVNLVAGTTLNFNNLRNTSSAYSLVAGNIKIEQPHAKIEVYLNVMTSAVRTNLIYTLVDDTGALVNSYGVDQICNGSVYGRGVNNHNKTGQAFIFYVEDIGDYNIKLEREANAGVLELESGTVFITNLR